MVSGFLFRECVLVEPEDRALSFDEDGTFDQIRLLHHQVDRFLLRLRQRPFLEHRTAAAHEIEEVVVIDVLLEELARRGIAIDVTFVDVDALLLQKTSGVAAGGSGGLPVKDRLGHTVPRWRAQRGAARARAIPCILVDCLLEQ
jgi:hypothetical protein